MTREQKEAFLNSWFGASDGSDWTHGMAGSFVNIINAQFDKAISAYTRAVPDVPELVRYRPAVYMEPCLGGMFNDEFGEYVLHSQAAEIIAANDAEIERLKEQNDKFKWQVRDTCTRAEAAEAKLAQYEAQKPIGFVSPSFFDSLNIKNAYSVAAFVVMEKSIKYNTPLYASPAPAADLKSENERHKQALEFYADKANWESGDFQHSVDEHLGHNVLTLNMPHAINDQGKIARAALNVEASND